MNWFCRCPCLLCSLSLSLTHSLTRSLTDTLNHTLTHSLSYTHTTHSFPHIFTHSPSHSPSFPCSHTHPLMCPVVMHTVCPYKHHLHTVCIHWSYVENTSATKYKDRNKRRSWTFACPLSYLLALSVLPHLNSCSVIFLNVNDRVTELSKTSLTRSA